MKVISLRELLKDNIELMKQWNYEKNDNSLLENLTTGSTKKVFWVCEKGHEWEAMIYCKAKGTGCPICANQKVLKGYNDLTTTNPELAKEWDYNKNSLKPDQITKGSNKIVWWICPNCNNSYDKSVNKRNSGENCPYCSGHRVLKGFNDLKTWCQNNNRKDLLREFDEEKNDFNTTDITFGSGKKIWWICPNGHSYQATLHHRINMNTGCGKCSHKVFESGYNDLATTNPEIAKEWDYKKNKKKPNEVMAGSNNTKYWFICPKGHSYQTTILGRKRGNNCPKCAMERHTSFPEKAIYYYMKKYLKNVKENYHNKIIGTKEIDIYLEDYKLGIEFDGRVWHKNYKRDLEKDNQCYKNGIELIRIREKGCTEYESQSIKKYVQYDNRKDLDNSIAYIIDYLNNKFNLKIIYDIDTNRDEIKILELMNLYEKENSIYISIPEIKKYWDKTRNGLITPEQISHGSAKKIYLICPTCGYKWSKKAHDIKKSLSCPKCSDIVTVKGHNDLFSTNPELKKIWSKNNKIDPTTVRKGSNKKVLWVCNNCGNEYEMMIINKTNGRGCPYCSNHRIKKGHNDLATTNPDLVMEWDYRKNTIKPTDVVSGSNKKVWWICQICNGSYQMTISSRCNKGFGCPFCSGHRVLEGYNDLATKRPDLLNEWDYKKNNINPIDVSEGSNKKVWWICNKCGYEWKTGINNRCSGKTGCPKCGRKKVETSISKSVLQYSLDGKLIAEYKSASEAIRKTGITSLHRACRGEYKSSGGYIWKYKEK